MNKPVPHRAWPGYAEAALNRARLVARPGNVGGLHPAKDLKVRLIAAAAKNNTRGRPKP